MCFKVLLLFSGPVHGNGVLGKSLEGLLLTTNQPPRMWKDGENILSFFLIRNILL